MTTCPGFVVPGLDGPSFDSPAFVGPGFVGSPISTVQEDTGSLLTERGINKQYTDHLQCIEWRLQATLAQVSSDWANHVDAQEATIELNRHMTETSAYTAYKCKKHSLSHQLTAQLRIENSKNKKNGDKTYAAVDI